MSLNVFLYNLPEDMIRVVRLQNCDKLEDALSIVMEEVNFLSQYNSRNKNRQNSTQHKSPQYNTQQMPNFKPFIPQNNNYGQNFKFTQPQNFNNAPNKFPQNQGFKLGIPQQSFSPGFKFGIPFQNQSRPLPNQTNFKFGIPPQPTGYRPFMPNNSQFRYNNYGQPAYQPQFKFGIPNSYPQQTQGQRPSLKHDNDISMRTAIPQKLNYAGMQKPNNLFYANELNVPEYIPETEYALQEELSPYDYQEIDRNENIENNSENFEEEQHLHETIDTENFRLQASTTHPPK